MSNFQKLFLNVIFEVAMIIVINITIALFNNVLSIILAISFQVVVNYYLNPLNFLIFFIIFSIIFNVFLLFIYGIVVIIIKIQLLVIPIKFF